MRILALALVAIFPTLGAARADCSAEVNDAFAKLRQSHAFRMETTIINAQGTLTMKNDYVLPDRMHQSVSLGADQGTMQMILIGGKAWSNKDDSGWAPVPDQYATTIAKQMKDTVADPPKDESNFECLGDVTFEGKTYKAYRTKRAAGKDAGSVSTNLQTVYVDKEAGIPVRNIVTPEADPNKRLYDGTFSLRSGLTIDPPPL